MVLAGSGDGGGEQLGVGFDILPEDACQPATAECLVCGHTLFGRKAKRLCEI